MKSFADLTAHLSKQNCRKRLAAANAVDIHTLQAISKAVESGIVEAFLIGDVTSMLATELFKDIQSPYIHFVNIADATEATLEAVRMVKSGEADILMKGLVNSDVLLRAILDKEKGIHTPGAVLSFTAAMEIPSYHKLIFIADPVVIPSPNIVQRRAMINYCIDTARKFEIQKPKIALIHATEVSNPKIQYMQDYMDIKHEWQNGKFGDVILDGPLDIYLAMSNARGSLKNVASPVLGDADILIFPNFECANTFYKAVSLFANAEMAGLLLGTDKPVVLTSRSDSMQSKLYSIAMACVLT
jgi:phosphate butyryltransferase